MTKIPKKCPLPPYPNGWYALMPAAELAKGSIKALQFMGEELVLYRTESGQVALSSAYCPHLGAHFAHGGQVKGEQLQCPFHFFEFNTEGKCTATGYGTKPPPKCRLKTWPVQERNGFILAWHHYEGLEPSFEIPSYDFEGWTDFITARYVLNSHPQETTENLVDLGHFIVVHGYENIEIFTALQREGPYAWAEYGMTRPQAALGQKNVKARFKAHAWGLGFSFVEATVPKYDLHTRMFVLPTPLNDGEMQLIIGLSLKHIERPSRIHPLLGLLPKSLVHRIVAQQAFKAYAHDVEQDFKIWENKTYIHPPVLAQGDGPVWQYREWTQQFYEAQALERSLGQVDV